MAITKNTIYFTIIFITILSNYKTNSQDFIVTDYYIDQFTLDPFSKDIYFTTISPFTLKTNIYTKTIDTTLFPNFPVFANKKHIAGYSEEDRIFFYDFDSESSYLLLDSSLAWIDLQFSPNDSAILINGTYHEIKDYRIQKSGNYPRINSANLFEDNGKYVWSSDSTLILRNNRGNIFNYYIKSGKIDTLVAVPTKYYDYAPPHFDYNSDLNAIAYSFYLNNTKVLRLLYLDTMKDSLLFIGEFDGDVELNSLTWSPNNKKLAFISFGIVGQNSGLLIYDLELNQTFEIIPSLNYGLKYNIEWMNNDTILYLDATAQKLMGLKADTTASVLSVEEKTLIPQIVQITNYPNPFNNMTIIEYTLSESAHVKIMIFDVLGQYITKLTDDKKSSGTFKVIFNAQNLTSGVYYCVAMVEDNLITKKIIYIK